MRRIIVIGGGSRNALLNRLIRERTGIEVLQGEAEPTTVGNILVQEEALARVSS
jgi:rhamnulokinase